MPDISTPSGLTALTNAQLDEALETAVVASYESEKLICSYLTEMRDRRGYVELGFTSIYDYASERFGFCERKTRCFVSLGRKLQELPKIREALRSGKLGWCKASQIASRAKPEDEAMWLDTALSVSVRELERRMRDGTDTLASTIHFWMTDPQRGTWENALEICRRVSGANVSPGEALELIAGEFIATYAHLLREEDGDRAREEEAGAQAVPALPPMVDDALVCPEEADILPSPFEAEPTTLDDAKRQVLERDDFQCGYPSCSARSQLHVHHIVFRSRGGTHEPANLITLCTLHHRMLHGGVIGVSGRAPDELSFRPPKLMALALDRRARNGLFVGELDLMRWPNRQTFAGPPGSEQGGAATLTPG